MKTCENSGKELKNVRMNFSPTCRQKPESQCSTTVYCQCNSILQRPKKNIVFITWLIKIGFVRAKNIWLVIMTGNLLSIILRINLCFATNFSQLVAKMRLPFSLNFEPWEGTCDEASRTFARLFGDFQQIVATFPFQSAWHIPGFKIQSYCWEAVIHVASKTVFIVYCKI